MILTLILISVIRPLVRFSFTGGLPFALAALALSSLSCATEKDPVGGPKATVFGTDDPFDVPAAGLTIAQVNAFNEGDALFGLPLRDHDGIGPLYTRTSCGACHAKGVRGPGLVQKMVVVESDGWTPAADQSKLPFGHTVHPLASGAAQTPILPPADDATVKVTTRIGPPVLGRGYMEAVADQEIERVAAEQATRTDGIHGRINHVVYASEANTDTRFHAHQPGDRLIGRFGLKARIGTIDDFTADAFQGDMGITSPLRPTEFPNPDGLTDDLKPGIDVGFDSVNNRANYIRTIAIPSREVADPRGVALFNQVQCAACHVPAMKTRADYPFAPLAGIDAPLFTDFLLHDMGGSRADGLAEGEASGRDWRTAPLLGLRFNRQFLHDGVASTIEEAILSHGGPDSEAHGSVTAFQALSAADQALLVEFVSSL